MGSVESSCPLLGQVDHSHPTRLSPEILKVPILSKPLVFWWGCKKSCLLLANKGPPLWRISLWWKRFVWTDLKSRLGVNTLWLATAGSLPDDPIKNLMALMEIGHKGTLLPTNYGSISYYSTHPINFLVLWWKLALKINWAVSTRQKRGSSARKLTPYKRNTFVGNCVCSQNQCQA